MNFCWVHKSKRCFKGFPFEKVCAIVLIAADKGMLRLVEDEQGICGVAIIQSNETIVKVDFLVAVRSGFKTFIDYYKKFHNGKQLIGERDGQMVNFNTRILCQHLRRT